jgi:diacylglycerol kinase family enzyme
MSIHSNKLLVHNRSAGTGDIPEELFEGFLTIHPDELEAALKDAEPNVLVAVWGGDGTMRSVANLARNSNVTLLPCPGGTHNHFAKAAGFRTVDDVANGLATQDSQMVDTGLVNDEPFLNNACVGWYVDLVARRERYQQHMPRRLAKLLSVLMHVTSIKRVRINIDGVDERVWLVWIGNGEYSTDPDKGLERKSLTDGVLDIRILRAGVRMPKLRALLAVLNNDVESSPLIVRRIDTECVIKIRSPRIEIALDGELITVTTPLRIVCSPQLLRIVASAERTDSRSSAGV